MDWQSLEVISSNHNSTYQLAHAAVSGGKGKKTELMILEGLRQVETALESENCSFLFFRDDLSGQQCFFSLKPRILQEGLPVRRLKPSLFDSLTDTRNAQGVIGLFNYPAIAEPTEPFPKNLSLVALESVSDPGNLGTITRTAEALGVDGILLIGNTVSPFNPKSLRASMGSSLYMRFYRCSSVERLRELCVNLPILTADLSGKPLEDWRGAEAPQYRGYVLLLGNEAHGLSEEARQAAQETLTIRMPGKAESLNLSAAAAIFIWNLQTSLKKSD